MSLKDYEILEKKGIGISGFAPQGQPGFEPQGPPGFGPQSQPGFGPPGQPGFGPPGQPGFAPSAQQRLGSQGQPEFVPPGFEPPRQPGLVPPGQPGYVPPGQPGYVPPGQPGYVPPGQPGYVPPGQSGYIPPGQPGYIPPGQPGYIPPGQPGFGQGEQGGVFIAIDKKTKEKVAIKKIPINYQDFRFEKEINNEINSLKTINCENSLKYYTHFKENGFYYIVTELCDSDLKTYVEKEHTNRFTSEEIREIFIQLNNAFRKMRQNKIMHRDLKLANILIKNLDNGKKLFKLGDFGKSRVLVSNRPGYYEKTRIGEYTIKAPELCKGSRYEKLFYDDKCDLWSIGVMMHHIYFQNLPPLYQRSDFIEDFDQYYYYLINNVRNSRHMHPQLRDLMFKLLVIDPEYRISWYHYFNHPFFTGS